MYNEFVNLQCIPFRGDSNSLVLEQKSSSPTFSIQFFDSTMISVTIYTTKLSSVTQTCTSREQLVILSDVTFCVVTDNGTWYFTTCSSLFKLDM